MSDQNSKAPPPGEPAEAAETAQSAEPAESFGRWLARERELRGISLKQIAEPTRISAAHLRALERDEAKSLPARVFVLGFIRAYALAIGISPDEAVLRYQEQCLKDSPPEEEAKRRGLRKRVVAGIAAAAVGLGAAGYLLWRR